MSRPTRRIVAGSIALPIVAPLALAAMLAGGCASTPDLDDVSYHAISRNITPEIQGVTERPIDIDRNMRMNFNQDLRAMWGDLGRMWMTNAPSALSPHRTIATSGQPR